MGALLDKLRREERRLVVLSGRGGSVNKEAPPGRDHEVSEWGEPVAGAAMGCPARAGSMGSREVDQSVGGDRKNRRRPTDRDPAECEREQRFDDACPRRGRSGSSSVAGCIGDEELGDGGVCA